jgi:hypothetical protein
MTKTQKTFVLEKLIPFILREQGRGFAMSSWHLHAKVGAIFAPDGVSRKIPVCGTVACIGGSIGHLKNMWDNGHTDTSGKAIGLSYRRAHKLFYCWEHRWPKNFSHKYARSRTPLGKARVVCALLKEVVRTNGKILDGGAK